ncbi:gliding motility-associated C-terminal domain-containing protein [Pedobacter aquatilis]|uniref:T9SS type B sorting domain-containing protein n=1 Tax=Pedobacter aquatilis TaxID=351343 RepID=UPI00292CBECB|nr:gliding motility-associated C-terminal domain-containing protein [Pedobacter aquatilis]
MARIKLQQAEIHIPDFFIPQAGTKSAGFEIVGLEYVTDNHFYIVNHWGKEVYKSRNYKNNWMGEGLKSGSYYYMLMIKESQNRDWKTFKGHINLMCKNDNEK